MCRSRQLYPLILNGSSERHCAALVVKRVRALSDGDTFCCHTFAICCSVSSRRLPFSKLTAKDALEKRALLHVPWVE
jgi:hypothetical protein